MKRELSVCRDVGGKRRRPNRKYDSRRGRLTIDARSTVRSATLSVYVTLTGELIGTLSNKRNGRYQGQFSWPVNPESITIKSSHGGNATAAVTSK